MPADLTAREIAALGHGRHRVTNNLYLLVDDRRRSWVFRYISPTSGRMRDMGLGPVDIVTVARAKEDALRHRLTIHEGRDPLDERRAGTPKKGSGMTFKQVAKMCFDAKRPEWRSEKHAAQWWTTVEESFPVLGHLAIKNIGVAEVMAVLEPIWKAKQETANRLRGRIEAILNYASARQWRAGTNPAAWRGHLENLLAARKKTDIVHRPALALDELPALWSDLAGRDGITAMALRFTLLTTVRSGAVLGARWVEIDLDKRLWTVPASRMKNGIEHTVPLSKATLDVLRQAAAIRQNEYVFPGQKQARPLRETAMMDLLEELRPGSNVTVHGTTRAGFRGWCGKHGIAEDLRRSVLAHGASTKVDEAYWREKLVPERLVLMENWARFLMTPRTEATVVPIGRGREKAAAR
jgi:integrase